MLKVRNILQVILSRDRVIMYKEPAIRLTLKHYLSIRDHLSSQRIGTKADHAGEVYIVKLLSHIKVCFHHWFILIFKFQVRIETSAKKGNNAQ